MDDKTIKKPWVSFCTSTYKRPVFLKKSLESMLRQTYQDFEIIVSDNDPEGSAEALVKEVNDPRVRYFNNGSDLGYVKSFNKSIERSDGDFIIMFSDDDPVYPDMLETFHQLHIDHPDHGMFLSGCDWFCTDPEMARLYKLNIGTNSCLSNEHEVNHTQAFSPAEFLQVFFSLKLFSHYLWSACMISRDILIRAGGLPSYGTPFLSDYAYLGILSSHSGCVVINKALCCQTLHLQNFGRSQNDQIAIALKNFPVYMEAHMAHLREWLVIKEQMQRFAALWAVSHLAFLYRYVKGDSLRETEKEIFKIDLMKKYRFKYFLKSRSPFVHDILVKLKKAIKN